MAGLTPAEALIMDLWDAGKSKQQIQRELRVPQRRLKSVINYYHADDELRLDNGRIAAGSHALAAAIHQARKQA